MILNFFYSPLHPLPQSLFCRARVDEKKISASGSIVAAGIAAIGAFLFGYSLGCVLPGLRSAYIYLHTTILYAIFSTNDIRTGQGLQAQPSRLWRC